MTYRPLTSGLIEAVPPPSLIRVMTIAHLPPMYEENSFPVSIFLE